MLFCLLTESSRRDDRPTDRLEALQQQQQANQKRLAEQPDNYGLLLVQGKLLLELGEYSQAKEHYSQALVHYPQDADFWMQRGFSQARQQQFAAALADYEQSLQFRPQDRDTLHVKADALLMLERDPEALETFNTVLGYYPNSDHLWYDRGLVLQRLGQTGLALRSFERALKIEPAAVEHWLAVAQMQQALGDGAGCDRTLQRGLKRHPQSLSLWEIQLNRLLDQQAYERALAACDRWDAVIPTDNVPQRAASLIARATALARLQRPAAAQQAWATAQEQDGAIAAQALVDVPELGALLGVSPEPGSAQ